MTSRGEEPQDDEIPIEGGERKRVTPGGYHARVTEIRKVERFNRRLVHFRFSLCEMGPNNGIQLDGFVPLGEGKKVGRDSKLARWNRILSAYSKDRADRVSFRRFKEYLLEVEVRTVERDHQQRPLAECNRYEVVDQIVGVVGKLG
jgi:hypothetical protein